MKCSLGIFNFLEESASLSHSIVFLYFFFFLHWSLREPFLSLLAILWNSVFRFWIFTGRTDGEAEAPVLWPPDAKSWLLGKDPDAGKDWGQEEKRMTEDKMVGWHHQIDGLEFEQALGIADGQGGLECWGLWGHKESDMTQQLNWTELIQVSIFFIFSLPFTSLLSQLFVRPPQKTILLFFCISSSWGWFWSLPSVKCYECP